MPRTRTEASRPRCHAALVLLTLLAAAGCYNSMGRGIAAGATTELYERRDTLGIVAATMVDSAFSRAASSLSDSLQIPLDSVFSALVDNLGARALRQQTALTDQLSVDLTGLVDTLFAESSEGFGELFAKNSAAIRDSLNAFIDQWVRTGVATARESVVPLVADAADSVTSRIIERLSMALRGEFRDDVIDLAFMVADTLQTTVEEPFLRLGQAAVTATIGIFLLIVGAVAVLLIAVKRSRKAMDVVTDAVHDWSVEQAQAQQPPARAGTPAPAPRHTSLAEVIEERARSEHVDTRRLSRVIEAAELVNITGYHEIVEKEEKGS